MTNTKMLYVIGEPGSGKSTLVAALTSGLNHADVSDHPVPHRIWFADEPVVEIGRYRETFSGTDALGMAIQPKVIDAIRTVELLDMGAGSYLAEGDRLGTGSFFDAVLGLGVDLEVAYVNPGPQLAEERRRARAAALGVDEQNAAWVAGRRTKAANLAERFAAQTIELIHETVIENVARLVMESRVAGLLALSVRP